MKGKGYMTDEQIIKLDCDAHAFCRAAKLIDDEIQQKGIKSEPEAFAWKSMKTVMMCNLGMAFELRLKLLLIKTGIEVLESHKLAKLFSKLSSAVRSDLDTEYVNLQRPISIVALKLPQTKEGRPDPPDDNRSLDTLAQFLEYLDDIGLYSQRYSFECFKSAGWNFYLDHPIALFDLLEKIEKYTAAIRN